MTSYADSPRDTDIKSICLNSRFGDLKFEKSLPFLEKMQQVLVELEDLDYHKSLTTKETAEIQNIKSRFKQFIDQITNFNLSGTPAQTRMVIEDNIETFYQNDFVRNTRSALIFLRQESNPTRETEKELRKTLTNAKQIETELQKKLSAIQKEEEKIDTKVKVIGTKLLAKDFQDQFDTHEIQATMWLKKSQRFYWGLMIIVVLDFASYMLIFKDADIPQKIEYGVFTFIFIAVLYYGLSFCSRNFDIQKNLAVINRHRRNVAETFQRFLESKIDDAETKNVFLKEASQAMFKHDSTGYLSKEQMQISTPVQEMVTKIISKV